MTKVNFYHLQKISIEQALAKILEKALASGKKAVVKIGNDDRVEFLNTALWTYSDQSFLPHGSKKDGNAEQQPVWLTSGDDVPNGADILFLVDQATISIERLKNFDMVCNLFDGASNDALQQARDFWKEIKNAEIECCYWQQDDNGVWKVKG